MATKKDKSKYKTTKHEERENKTESNKGSDKNVMNELKKIETNKALNVDAETLKKVEQLKDKLELFKKKVLEKFEDYVLGIALMPPEAEDKSKLNVFLLVDDSDVKKMSRSELKEKLRIIIHGIAKEVDSNINPNIWLLSELWQELFDGKYDILTKLVIAAPIFDRGMIAALRVAQVHKDMVVKKFERYIVCYVLAGSLVQGRATPKSDIDVFIVVDDTDVKRMTRAELKDKLRAIIIGMGIDASKATGVENKLNVQVYILTDFWENIKEANPVIFTFLRDGVPLYDRGIFMAWKQLLKMGRVRPSSEAIDMYMSTGDQILKRVRFKMQDIAMEDFFYAILTPTQAAIMLYGLAPPTPKETPELIREVFVRKEKLLEEDYVKMLEKIIDVRKKLEHGDKKTVTGREIDELALIAEKYLKRLKGLFKQIEELKEKESVLHQYDAVIAVVRDALILEGAKQLPIDNITKEFKKRLIEKNLVSEKYLRILINVIQSKKRLEEGKLSRIEAQDIVKKSRDFLRHLIEHIERKKAKELSKARIRVKSGNKFGELILLGNDVFIIHDLEAEDQDKEITKGKLLSNGSISDIKQSNLEELEKAITQRQILPRAVIKEKTIESLKNIFGRDVEILI